MNKHMKSLLIRNEKVPPKVRKLNALTMEVWDTMLMIILVPKILKILCRQHGVILTLKRVLQLLLKMQGTIQMTSYPLLHMWNL